MIKPILLLTFVLCSCSQPDSKTTAQAVPAPGVAHSEPVHKQDSVLVRILDGGGYESVDSCVYVSFDLEKDSAANHDLREYLCHNQFGIDTTFSAETMKKMVSRPSFTQMILLFYDGDKYSRVTYYGEQDKRDELRNGYLSEIRSCCIAQLYTIADSLLQRNYLDGIECLWDTTDIAKLSSLNGYLSRMDTTNFYYDVKLATIFHNTGKDSLRDVCLARAGRLSDHKTQFNSLKSLMRKNKIVNPKDYGRVIYGED